VGKLLLRPVPSRYFRTAPRYPLPHTPLLFPFPPPSAPAPLPPCPLPHCPLHTATPRMSCGQSFTGAPPTLTASRVLPFPERPPRSVGGPRVRPNPQPHLRLPPAPHQPEAELGPRLGPGGRGGVPAARGGELDSPGASVPCVLPPRKPPTPTSFHRPRPLNTVRRPRLHGTHARPRG